jgi:hypothetical protein
MPMRNLSAYTVTVEGTYPRRRMFAESILSPRVWRSIVAPQAMQVVDGAWHLVP